MNTQPLLAKLLKHQQEERGQGNLLKQGTFTIQWRAKVGSFLHPDGETIVSAGEPCGAWKPKNSRPEDKRNVNENWQQLRELPLNGYLPGSCLRGLVRSWANQHPKIKAKMENLLGYQDNNNEIYSGKIEFLDAYPTEPSKLCLDIVNPQQEFQVYHQGQSSPLSFYTFGDGKNKVDVLVTIRAIPHRNVTSEEINEVWDWVEQALCYYGVGSRTASGYGVIKSKNVQVNIPQNYGRKLLIFSLYSQGCYGAIQERGNEQLRPSHWRGWLRSWTLRFLLGVMSEANAKITLGELLGKIGDDSSSDSFKGCVKIKMIKGKTWGESSGNQPNFYVWKGQLEIIAPEDILDQIILPIIRFAASLGGVGRGWRRPLHIFAMNTGRKASRGSHLILKHQVIDKTTQSEKSQNFALNPTQTNLWQNNYRHWLEAVRKRWSNRIAIGVNDRLKAEIFSPTTCAVYLVPYPETEPINLKEIDWDETNPLDTRGEGMDLIYGQKYKKKTDVGGNAGGGSASCSWVTIRRINVTNQEENTDCQETVCLFMGGVDPVTNPRHLRAEFLKDLRTIPGSSYLFGLT
jgi:CRISPR-associated protein Cmr6